MQVSRGRAFIAEMCLIETAKVPARGHAQSTNINWPAADELISNSFERIKQGIYFPDED